MNGKQFLTRIADNRTTQTNRRPTQNTRFSIGRIKLEEITVMFQYWRYFMILTFKVLQRVTIELFSSIERLIRKKSLHYHFDTAQGGGGRQLTQTIRSQTALSTVLLR